jgi:NAD(P)-dependent dehydrogenase (short-subunit alcohol dehydrogenase family)
MDLKLQGKRAIVTGGSRGIGLATARALADEGARVAIVARDRERLERAAVEGRDVPFLPVVADTTDDGSVRAMVEAVLGELGGVEILVNAAATPGGGSAPPKLADLTDDELRVEVESKVLGYLRCARAVAPHLAAAGWGRIINVSGLAARQTGSLVGSVRNVSVAALTKNLADELGPDGVNVTVVHPGMTVTERTPGLLTDLAARRGVSPGDIEADLASRVSIGRLVTAEEVAAVIAFLASPLSVAINGDPIAVGGGVPGAIHY